MILFSGLLYLGSACICVRVCVYECEKRWRKGDGIMAMFDSVTGSY